ncbi:hypothetical protein BDK51DRAFT_36180 [Blyttiomyces helicus]|uniref:Chaperonin 10-like protein n=1 Tax=Blyttiomyces helicus TaxID=388810 RepID=A0A4P9W2J6_9FUNG|nr:hypothetical protein BDK51DRAFT_36180 [Blyttiomyces helicus]|eukprot:RKO85018.1 hypothetical protein BDK51DRAFT_36180 [Blyttiomyces helicus]
MSTHRAVVLSKLGAPLTIEHLPTPSPTSGQLLVAPLISPVIAYQHALHSGERGNPLTFPLVPGTSTIGRPGDLVLIDPTLRGRDNPGVTSLQALYRMHPALDNTWHNGSWAERFLAPLENSSRLNEASLLGPKSAGARGYTLGQLGAITQLLVPYGGWRAANLRPGQTVAVAYASGAFGGSAIDVALGLGAGRVIALGRRNETLLPAIAALKSPYPGRVVPVVVTGDIKQDADAIQAATPGSTGLDPDATLVLMGGVRDNISLPYQPIMFKNITIKGRFMYCKEWVDELVAIVEAGSVSLERQQVRCFSLDDHAEAVEAAKNDAASGRGVVLTPVVEK